MVALMPKRAAIITRPPRSREFARPTSVAAISVPTEYATSSVGYDASDIARVSVPYRTSTASVAALATAITATVMTSTRNTGSESSRRRPALTWPNGPGRIPIASDSAVPGSAGRAVRMPPTVMAAPTKHPADTAKGAQGARTKRTPAANGPARSSARVSTVTNRALARSNSACGTILTSRDWADPSAKVSAEVMAKPMAHSTGIVTEPVTTTATRTRVNVARTKCAAAITLAGSKRSTRAPAGIATSSQGRLDATATAATAAAEEFTDTARSGSAMSRSPSPVSEPTQAITRRRKVGGRTAADEGGRGSRTMSPSPRDAGRMVLG